MKKLLFLIIACIGLSSALYAQKKEKQNSKETVEFLVTSETLCDNCVKKINSNIPFEKGVTAFDINREKNSVKITYRKDKTSSEKLKNAFSKMKMEVEEITPQNPQETKEK